MHKRLTMLLILVAGCSQATAPPMSQALGSVGATTGGSGSSSSGSGSNTSPSGSAPSGSGSAPSGGTSSGPTPVVPPGMIYTSSPPTLTFAGEMVLTGYGSQNVSSISINTLGYPTPSITTNNTFNDISIGTAPGTYPGCSSPAPYATFWDIQAGLGLITQFTCVPAAGYIIRQNTNGTGAASFLTLANQVGASANFVQTRDNTTATCADGADVLGPYALAPSGPCTVLDSGGSSGTANYPLVLGTGGGTTAVVIQRASQLYATGSPPLQWLKAVNASGAISTTVGEGSNGSSVTNIVGPSAARTQVNGVPIAANYTGSTGSIGGSALANGACSSGTVPVANSTTSMVVVATPAGFPGAGFWWAGYVSANGTVTVEVCNATGTAGTPAASTYNVRVLQ